MTPVGAGGGGAPIRPVARPRYFATTCRTAEQRNRLNARYNAAYSTAEFSPVSGAPFQSRMVGIDTGHIRVIAMRESGAARLRAAWRDDAFAAWFPWRSSGGQGRVGELAPQLTVAGPGTEMLASQDGELHTLRVSVRGEALQRLRDEPRSSAVVVPWLRAGLGYPRAAARAEWRLQQAMIRATALTKCAAGRGLDVDPLVDLMAAEILGQLVDVLAEARDPPSPEPQSPPARRRIVDAALELLDASGKAPASVAGVCRRLGVSERTLQRAFQDQLGVGLRAFERERRLRGVHGAILADGERRSVTDIAMSFGFWHLGRFAGAYRALFGCSPSETRRRVWHQSV